MRTTITLDDQLFARLKERATESGASVSRLIEQAVRLLMRAPRAQAGSDEFELVTYGAGGRFSERNIDKASALLEADDIERFRRRG